MGGQVLTTAERWPDDEGFSDQGLIPIQAAVATIIRHIYVRQDETREARATEPSPPIRADGAAPARKVRGKRAKKARRGGWPSTKYISRALRYETLADAGLLARAGYGFTVFLTARAPLGLTDGRAKRHVALSFARLGQALERKGHDYIGLTTYEKRVGGLLHGHALVHVRRDCMWVVKRWADRFDEHPVKPYERIESVALHGRPAVHSDLGYVLKQRRFNGRYERPGNFYQKGEPIVGTRVSFTKMARVIIERTKQQMAPKAKGLGAPVRVSKPIARRVVELARRAA
jgi:hypothetical protein